MKEAMCEKCFYTRCEVFNEPWALFYQLTPAFKAVIENHLTCFLRSMNALCSAFHRIVGCYLPASFYIKIHSASFPWN